MITIFGSLKLGDTFTFADARQAPFCGERSIYRKYSSTHAVKTISPDPGVYFIVDERVVAPVPTT
jgi:hypothetical protein